jgi:hypothetical protein
LATSGKTITKRTKTARAPPKNNPENETNYKNHQRQSYTESRNYRRQPLGKNQLPKKERESIKRRAWASKGWVGPTRSPTLPTGARPLSPARILYGHKLRDARKIPTEPTLSSRPARGPGPHKGRAPRGASEAETQHVKTNNKDTTTSQDSKTQSQRVTQNTNTKHRNNPQKKRKQTTFQAVQQL